MKYKSRTVKIGNVYLGGDNPILLQSMTNTDTLNTAASVAQCIRIFEAGGGLVRLTTQGISEAENLANIKNELVKRGFTSPLAADVHFNPKVAEVAAAIVEKVRINPGNYVDKKQFRIIEYTDPQYKEELEKVGDRLLPLIAICKQYGTVIRIGVNHGSLSDRIMSRYGDSPLGMVESALEFIRICRKEDFHSLVISLKASNTGIMIRANRLLVKKMMEENLDYPIHLGVTEAGEGEDGRIKSAVGMGTLLAEGIGDTIRISLSEDPEFEIPVARKLVECISAKPVPVRLSDYPQLSPGQAEYRKRTSKVVANIGGNHPPVVVGNCMPGNTSVSANLLQPDVIYNCIFVPVGKPSSQVIPWAAWTSCAGAKAWPLLKPKEYLDSHLREIPHWLELTGSEMDDALLEKLKLDGDAVLVLPVRDLTSLEACLDLLTLMEKLALMHPVILKIELTEDDPERMQLLNAVLAGRVFTDGAGDGIWIVNKGNIAQSVLTKTSFTILQACRLRMSKTEYISCPSCGRTLFDLQQTIASIRERTSHLKGLRIGIMGCIVNGPGEMADADYGYVGAGPGKINLYKQQEVVKRNIPVEHAVEELIALIREHGDWIES
jgi:(E)-4-hydroxy-3-methylbut-2-enyl-diphosphate synthase